MVVNVPRPRRPIGSGGAGPRTGFPRTKGVPRGINANLNRAPIKPDLELRKALPKLNSIGRLLGQVGRANRAYDIATAIYRIAQPAKPDPAGPRPMEHWRIHPTTPGSFQYKGALTTDSTPDGEFTYVERDSFHSTWKTWPKNILNSAEREVYADFVRTNGTGKIWYFAPTVIIPPGEVLPLLKFAPIPEPMLDPYYDPLPNPALRPMRRPAYEPVSDPVWETVPRPRLRPRVRQRRQPTITFRADPKKKNNVDIRVRYSTKRKRPDERESKNNNHAAFAVLMAALDNGSEFAEIFEAIKESAGLKPDTNFYDTVKFLMDNGLDSVDWALLAYLLSYNLIEDKVVGKFHKFLKSLKQAGVKMPAGYGVTS